MACRRPASGCSSSVCDATLPKALAEEHLPRLEPEYATRFRWKTSSARCQGFAAVSAKMTIPDSWKNAVRERPRSDRRESASEMSNDRGGPVPKGSCPRSGHSERVCALPSRDARGNTALPTGCPARSPCNWIFDDQLLMLPNNETRAHMAADLARYLFAAAFGHAHSGESPKTFDFPEALMPSPRELAHAVISMTATACSSPTGRALRSRVICRRTATTSFILIQVSVGVSPRGR